MRRHLRIDGKAVRSAARGGRAPMLLSGVWDGGTTAAQLPVDVRKTNEIPVFRQLLTKIPDLAGTVITADQMHTQRTHARQIEAAGAFYIFTIGENQPRLFEAAGALPWESIAGDAWTVDRGHGRIDVRTIKTLPPTERIRALFPHVEQVFLVERYSYGTDGELPGAVAVLGITSLPPDQAGRAISLATGIISVTAGLVPHASAAVQGAASFISDLGFVVLAVCVSVAILRYRLYDIDRIISRTLAYTLVTGLLVGIYAGIVLLATRVLSVSSPVAVAASTLAAAALFNPLRRRVQQAVDRRFNRARYDADQAVMAFAARLKDAADLDSVRDDLAHVVSRSLEPAHLSVWVSHRD
jgi:predicted transposase YbfD/YdcC